MSGSATSLSSPETIYTENEINKTITTGIFSHALKIAHNRSSFDTTQCATYTEIIVTDSAHPYVIGTQMRFDSSNTSLSKIETIVTETGDWLFNAANTLKYAASEDGLWGEIAAAKRDTRKVIQAAADAYLDVFNDKNVKVPWGIPCARLEGGAYTGKGSPNDTCEVGIPTGVVINNRRYIIDEVLGTVDVFCTFSGIADTHEFRIQEGKIRFVHTMTNTGK
ncbi:hypothetical protein M7I_3327 [Glarea lozoyensis 74030]|nr:hypothetical protein M7I_3327 [Glarea lozoyensis 74030]